AEVENFLKAIALERELALVDQKPGVSTARCDLLRDLVEGELAVPELAEHEAEREERRGHRPRHDDLELGEVRPRELVARDDDGAVPGADARALREQRIVLLD